MCQHTNNVWLRRTVSKWRDGSIHRIHSRINRRAISCCGQSCSVMRVKHHRYLNILLPSPDNFRRYIWGHQSSHILEANRVAAHRRHLNTLLDKALNRMHGTRRIANHPLCVLPCLFGCLYGSGNIPQIIQRVENTEDIHPVLGRALYKSLHHIIREVRVLHNILPAQKHHMRRLRRLLLDGIQAIKRKLSQESQPGVNRRPTPCLKRPKTQCIQILQRGKHLGCSHASRR